MCLCCILSVQGEEESPYFLVTFLLILTISDVYVLDAERRVVRSWSSANLKYSSPSPEIWGAGSFSLCPWTAPSPKRDTVAIDEKQV